MPLDVMTKQIKAGVELKALDDAGHGLARIAMLSAIDHDGDTYAPGAFGEQWVQILAAHDMQSVPLGKARVFERGDEALAELHFNLANRGGREWHAAVKFDLDGCCAGAPRIQEWSFGFSVLDCEPERRQGCRVRVLKKLDVHEVSPVVRGAGVGTATLAMKRGGASIAHDLYNQHLARQALVQAAAKALAGNADPDARLAQDLYARHVARLIGRRI